MAPAAAAASDMAVEWVLSGLAGPLWEAAAAAPAPTTAALAAPAANSVFVGVRILRGAGTLGPGAGTAPLAVETA